MIEKLLDEPYWPEIEKDIKEFSLSYDIQDLKPFTESIDQVGKGIVEMFAGDYFSNWILVPLESELLNNPISCSLHNRPNKNRDEEAFCLLIISYLNHFKSFWVSKIENQFLFRSYRAANTRVIFLSMNHYKGDSFIDQKVNEIKAETNLNLIFSLTREIVTYHIKSSHAFRSLYK